MAYFQKHQKRSRVSAGGNIRQQQSLNENKVSHQCKKESQSRQSYLKAFKKYYIEKLQDKRQGSSYLQNQQNNSQLFQFNDTRSQCQRLEQAHQKSLQLTEKSKHSIMTDSTKNSRQKPCSKMSRSKMVNLVDSNDCQIEQLLYSSINEVQRELMAINNVNYLAIENKMLKNSILKLKELIKEKLEVALKKNKEELTAMFDEYSTMIKKLLEDKEELTVHLERQKEKYAREEKMWKNIEESYQNKIAIIVEENAVQIRNTKKQVQQFLEMIIQYEEQGNKEKIQLENLRQKVVELQMENDRLNSERNSYQNTGKSSTINIDEKKLDKYAEKIEILLSMMDQIQNQNEQLKQFLKNCKCSRLNSEMIESQSSTTSENIKEIVSRYQKQLIQAEKDYLFEEEQIRQVLKKKDECIERLNLIISQLRKARYTTVDRMTEDILEKQLLQEYI